jgi:hypothetical protein
LMKLRQTAARNESWRDYRTERAEPVMKQLNSSIVWWCWCQLLWPACSASVNVTQVWPGYAFHLRRTFYPIKRKDKDQQAAPIQSLCGLRVQAFTVYLR